jgi:hypothetical protein
LLTNHNDKHALTTLLSTNHIAGAKALAGAVKDKSSLVHFGIGDNDIGDEGTTGKEKWR